MIDEILEKIIDVQDYIASMRNENNPACNILDKIDAMLEEIIDSVEENERR